MTPAQAADYLRGVYIGVLLAAAGIVIMKIIGRIIK